MCKQKGNPFCIELGADPTIWSSESPLPKPQWIEKALAVFIQSAREAMNGQMDSARLLLANSRESELRVWFDVHAQNSGTWRYKALGKRTPVTISSHDPVKEFANFETQLFARDNYHCRYCQSKVIPSKVFRAIQKIVGEESLPLKGTNAGRSGYYLMFCATLDHVIPHSLGGRTKVAHLVTCCWSCNYGKTNYTLDQLGLVDPFARAPLQASRWKGLTELVGVTA